MMIEKLKEFERVIQINKYKYIYYELDSKFVENNEIYDFENFIYFIITFKPHGREIVLKDIVTNIDDFNKRIKDIKLQGNEKLCIIPNNSLKNKNIDDVFNGITIGHFVKDIH